MTVTNHDGVSVPVASLWCIQNNEGNFCVHKVANEYGQRLLVAFERYADAETYSKEHRFDRDRIAILHCESDDLVTIHPGYANTNGATT